MVHAWPITTLILAAKAIVPRRIVTTGAAVIAMAPVCVTPTTIASLGRNVRLVLTITLGGTSSYTHIQNIRAKDVSPPPLVTDTGRATQMATVNVFRRTLVPLAIHALAAITVTYAKNARATLTCAVIARTPIMCVTKATLAMARASAPQGT